MYAYDYNINMAKNAVSSCIQYRRSVCELHVNLSSVRFKDCLRHFPSVETKALFLCLFAFCLIATAVNNDACGFVKSEGRIFPEPTQFGPVHRLRTHIAPHYIQQPHTTL